ncbi:MAG TPA: CotH kinase family protein, partial [Verrucomicrobiae bacterium]|nr:CotH kinase family protein [Verrucomicrobiae bacterium]
MENGFQPTAARSLTPFVIGFACITLTVAGLCGESAATRPRIDPGQELFTNGAVAGIRIQIAAAELDELRRDPRVFVRATLIEGSTRFDNVAVHLKGAVGSFRPIDDKPAFTLDFARFLPGRSFHGLRRIHLNNSVEDPSYCNELIGGELFRAAGIPAPRVGRAVVSLNERKLGLYVLKEGFTEDFLSCYFKQIGGNLYEPDEGHDVNQRLKKTGVEAPGGDRKALKALAKAALEIDLNQRWNRLERTLELDRFIRFMALEVMLCHRDGYCLARNNFRVYQDLDSGKMIFFPHGMDQLFGNADLPWMPHMAGLVAQAVMETPQGKQLYSENFRSLLGTLFKPETLSNRIDDSVKPLRFALSKSEFESVAAAAQLVKTRIAERHRQLEIQLGKPPVPQLEFTNGVCLLAGWGITDAPISGQMDQATGPDGVTCLHIRTLSEADSSWRTRAGLKAGRYRFEGRVRVSGARPLAFGKHQGVGLRVGGQLRQSEDLTGDSD